MRVISRSISSSGHTANITINQIISRKLPHHREFLLVFKKAKKVFYSVRKERNFLKEKKEVLRKKQRKEGRTERQTVIQKDGKKDRRPFGLFQEIW